MTHLIPIYLISFLLVLMPVNSVADESDEQVIYKVKAAFILNIARFVDWPENANGNANNQIVLCLYKNNPLGSAVTTIQHKTVAQRPLAILEIQSLNDSGLCNILLVPEYELTNFARLADYEFDRPILTIADLSTQDSTGIAHRGIVVALVRKNNGLGFEINLNQAEVNGLKMSSELLKLAKIVGNGN